MDHKSIRLDDETPPGSSRPAIAVSIQQLTMHGCSDCRDPTDRAAASKEGRKYDPPEGAVSGLNIIPTRITRGAISFSSSSHLPPIVGSRLMKPVIFAPGREKLATVRPYWVDTVTNTIGSVSVSPVLSRSGPAWGRGCDDQVGSQFNQLFGQMLHQINISSGHRGTSNRSCVLPSKGKLAMIMSPINLAM